MTKRGASAWCGRALFAYENRGSDHLRLNLGLQLPQPLQVLLAHAAYQQILLVEPVVDEVVEQVEILDEAGVADMDAGPVQGWVWPPMEMCFSST